MRIMLVFQERKFNMYVSYWTDHLSTKVFVETEEAQEFLRVSPPNKLGSCMGHLEMSHAFILRVLG